MQKTSIKKNFAYQMVYQLLILILPFITSPYIARVIGAEGLGIYSYSYSVAYYFVLFSNLGILNYGNREIARCRDNQEKLNETFSNIVFLHILVSIICCLVYILYVFNISDENFYSSIQFIYVLSGLFDISWFYFGIERFKLTVTRNTIIKIFNVICIFAFVKTVNDLGKYCFIMASGMLLSQLSLWIPLKKYVRFVKPQYEKMIIHLKPLVILFIPAIAVSLYKYMDKIMIGVQSSKMQLGFYENAEKVINIPLTIIVSFGTVMLPKMSNLFSNRDNKEVSKYIEKSMKYIMCLSYALTFGLAGIGKIFAPIFWGKEFIVSGYIIIGLASTVPFISFANILRTQYLIPAQKDRQYLISVICGAVANLSINWLLIPYFGAMGAMIGTIAAEILVCIVQSIAVKHELNLKRYIIAQSPFILFGILMFIFVFSVGEFLNTGILTLLIQILLGIIVYGIVCIIYFYLTEDEIILNIFQKMKHK